MKGPVDLPAYRRKAERALAGARLLLVDGDADGACNRAYYAMFYAANAALAAAGIVPPKNGYKTHSGLIAAFGTHVVMTGQVDEELGRSINKVQRSRRLADYFGDPFPVADATFIVEQAEAFVAEINARFFSEPLADVP